MRAFLLVCLLALAARAAPTVRWLDRFGNAQTRELESVEAESAREVKLRLKDGTEQTLPVWRLLELARENDGTPDEAALLRARRDVFHNLRLSEARPVLDRILGAKKGWQKEYAAAARAVLAERAGEKDAAARLDSFLKDYPESRHQSWVVLARARLRSSLGTDPQEVLVPFPTAVKKIQALGGPLAFRYAPFAAGSYRVLESGVESWKLYVNGVGPRLREEIQGQKDVAYHVAVDAAEAWGYLVGYRWSADVQIKLKEQPVGPLHRVEKLHRSAALGLPELRCDLLLEIGRLRMLCGDADGAREAYRQAAELAKPIPDPHYRDLAATGLKNLRK